MRSRSASTTRGCRCTAACSEAAAPGASRSSTTRRSSRQHRTANTRKASRRPASCERSPYTASRSATTAQTATGALGPTGRTTSRCRRRLTLNLGLRYDVYEFMNQPNLDKNRTYQVLKAIGSPYGALPKTDKNNFSPRIGIAWDVTGDGSNVVRGSYGLYYVQQIKNTYYQRNYLEKPSIFFIDGGHRFGHRRRPAGELRLRRDAAARRRRSTRRSSRPARGTIGYWYDPNLQDAQTHKIHAGYSHVFPHETVLSADYTHVLLQKGWRNLDINPLHRTGVRPHWQPTSNACTAIPNLMGVINIAASVNEGDYDELAVHFEQRFSRQRVAPDQLHAGLGARHGWRARRSTAERLAVSADGVCHRRRHICAVGNWSDGVRRAAPGHDCRRLQPAVRFRRFSLDHCRDRPALHANQRRESERRRQPAGKKRGWDAGGHRQRPRHSRSSTPMRASRRTFRSRRGTRSGPLHRALQPDQSRQLRQRHSAPMPPRRRLMASRPGTWAGSARCPRFRIRSRCRSARGTRSDGADYAVQRERRAPEDFEPPALQFKSIKTGLSSGWNVWFEYGFVVGRVTTLNPKFAAR